MKISDLTIQQRKQVAKTKCIFCKQEFMVYEDIEFLRIRYGRRIDYAFMHTACLLQSLSQLSGNEKVKGGYVVGKSEERYEEIE